MSPIKNVVSPRMTCINQLAVGIISGFETGRYLPQIKSIRQKKGPHNIFIHINTIGFFLSIIVMFLSEKFPEINVSGYSRIEN